MNYYALFLNTGGFIEKCLALIRYICNPLSKSYPHITIRVYKDEHFGIEEIIQKPIFYVNMIEAGSFNLDKDEGPYTVYIRFESEELDAIDYKPDFPFSFMHLTLYNGNEYKFAKKLLAILNKISWNVKLSFNEPLFLTTNSIGEKNTPKEYEELLNDYCVDVLGYSIKHDYDEWDDNYRLQQIQAILAKLEEYYKNKTIVVPEQNYNTSAQLEKHDGNLFYKSIPIKETAKNTNFVTPPEYGKDMAEVAFKYFGTTKKNIYFGDSAIGTGALFIALLRYVKEHRCNYQILSAIGVDVNQEMALEATRRCSGRGLRVIWGDSLLPEIDSLLHTKCNIMLVNPPYSRSSDINNDYKKLIQQYAYEQTGITVSATAGLYVYHILIMDKWLDDNGIAVWLIPSTFVQTQYGKALRKYLIDNVKLLQIHFYPRERSQFEKAMVSTCLLVFKKTSHNVDNEVLISNGESINFAQSKMVKNSELREHIDHWRNLLFGETKRLSNNDTVAPTFSDLFVIKRGIATGANDFFVMEGEEAKNRGIPEIALKPVLPKARYIKSKIIERDDNGKPLNIPAMVVIDTDLEESEIEQQYPSMYEYLQTAKDEKNGKAVVHRTLVKQRKPWYKQEKREAPMYVLTYMGRNKNNQPPLYFLLNRSDAIALNTYICLNPHKWLMKLLQNNKKLQEELLESLEYTAQYIIAEQTIMYSGNLQKMEPGNLKKLKIVSLPKEIEREWVNHFYSRAKYVD